jgi:cytochrome b561
MRWANPHDWTCHRVHSVNSGWLDVNDAVFAVVLGILTINTGGQPVTLPGLDLQIVLVGPDPLARKLIKDAHELIGNVFYWVIGIHALAAIAHHVFFRDNTLRRML